ncbi:MAG: His/Gly/Thr/Pro-type tRNA ligase C-terminal domain-containing protein [Candidatus Paceibacterota bacterium]|jgi:histidyl-tRNA synthetase
MNKKKETKFIACDNLDKIGEIAVYYGFTPTKSVSITKTDMDYTKDILENDSIDDETEYHGRLPLHVEEKAALLRTYNEQNMHTLLQPVMLYFKDPSRGSKKSAYHRYADLEILGPSGSIAEATLIHVARLILSEEGYKDTVVEINSTGDRDSIAKFTRELTAYYRKNINNMSPECRQLFKKDPFELLSSNNESCRALNEQAPKSLDFLTEDSRQHLEELLEYFEALNISYTINNSLIANRKYATETIFSIVNNNRNQSKKDQKILAVGMRYSGLAKRLGMKRDIIGVGISIVVKPNNIDNRKIVKKIKRPIASFVQLGVESKLLCLDIIERLRQIKVPLYVSLAKDRLGAQVSSIERYHTPYTIVIGKKEAVEHTAIVRDTDTRSQETVSLDELAKYMKKIETKFWSKQ